MHSYEKLLLATGGTPRELPGGGDGVVYFRTLDTYRRAPRARGRRRARSGRRRRLHRLRDRRRALAERLRGHDPLPRRGNRLASLFPPHLSSFVNDYYRGHGVTVLAGEIVETVANGSLQTEERNDGRGGRDRRRPRDRAEHRARRGGRARPSTTASSSTIAGAPAGATTSSPPATSRGSPSRCWVEHAASSTRITRTRTGSSSARTWPARTSRTTTCRSSTPISSTSATKRSATSIRGSTRSRSGASRIGRASSPTWTLPARAQGFLLWDVWDKVDAATELIAAGTVVEPDDLRALMS